MGDTLVTVVIPTYNRARYLAEAIESVLRQSHPAREIIVVDDGSTDDTREVAARFGRDVRYEWQPNAERGAARNRGLRLARGAFVTFLDSDDLWTPDKLARDLAAFARRPEFGLVYSDALVVDASLQPLRSLRRRGHEGRVTRHLLHDNFVAMGAHLVRTDVIRDAGGFREERALAGSEDWEAWVRLSTRTRFGHVARATTLKRAHEGNSMNDAAGMERSMRFACTLLEGADYLTPADRRHLPCARAHAALLSAIHYGTAGDRRAARSWLARAVRASPRVLLNWRFAYSLLHNTVSPELSIRLRALKRRVLRPRRPTLE